MTHLEGLETTKEYLAMNRKIWTKTDNNML